MKRIKSALDWLLCLLCAALVGFFNGWKYIRGITENEYLDKDYPESD